nr:hypothetical protein CFP56_32318 [Quercus suber]
MVESSPLTLPFPYLPYRATLSILYLEAIDADAIFLVPNSLEATARTRSAAHWYNIRVAASLTPQAGVIPPPIQPSDRKAQETPSNDIEHVMSVVLQPRDCDHGST